MSPSPPLSDGTHGRKIFCREFGATITVWLTPGPVAVTIAGSIPALATTTVKSKMDHTMFAVTVGQKSQPM